MRAFGDAALCSWALGCVRLPLPAHKTAPEQMCDLSDDRIVPSDPGHVGTNLCLQDKREGGIALLAWVSSLQDFLLSLKSYAYSWALGAFQNLSRVEQSFVQNKSLDVQMGSSETVAGCRKWHLKPKRLPQGTLCTPSCTVSCIHYNSSATCDSVS